MDLMTAEFILGHLNYWLFIVLMMTGLYIVIAKGNLVKKNKKKKAGKSKKGNK